MAKKQDSLPDPPGCGGWIGTVLLACCLVVVNGTCTLWILELLAPFFSHRDARLEQIFLFLTPLLLMAVQLRLLGMAWRWILPRNGNS